MIDKRILRAIQDRDPDGGTIEPTEAAYAAHERWAIEAYGREAWQAYRVGGWDDPADWQEGDHSHEFTEYAPIPGQGTLFTLHY